MGATIVDLTPVKTEIGPITSPTVVDVSSASLAVYSGGNKKWTLAFTLSDLGATNGSDVGILFTYNTSHPYYNLEGMGYKYVDGVLTLCAGGFAYNGGDNASSPWKMQTYDGYLPTKPLSVFYTFNDCAVSVAVSDGITVTQLGSIAGSGVKFASNTVSGFNFMQKASSNTWNPPNAVTGVFTLENLDVYTDVLTEAQMLEYATLPTPEPATASLGLLGLAALMMRRRRA